MRAEPIYKGATRPVMMLGVPFVPLVIVVGSAMLLVMWVGLLYSWWVLPVVVSVLAPLFGWMRFLTHRDDQRFRQMFFAVRLWLPARNHMLWRCRSYSPYLHRGARHVWHR